MTDDGVAATVNMFLQEEQSADEETAHLKEDLSGIAFESAGLLQGIETQFVDDFIFA